LRASCQIVAALKRARFGKHAMHDHRQSAGAPTLALLTRARLAIRIAQLFSYEQPLGGLVSMIWPAP